MEEPKKVEKIPVRFHFIRLNFTPFNEVKQHTAKQILERVVSFLSIESVAGRGILIDKHEGRTSDLRRPLFVTSAVIMHNEHRVKLSIALLRPGKIPMVKPKDKFLVLPLNISNGEIAELTHVFVDYNAPVPVLCVEFNSNGPRVSDIEYYLRVIARDKLRLARATEMEFFMDSQLDKTIADLRNVLRFEIKMQPQNISRLETSSQGYMTGMSTMGHKLKPSYIKVQASFQTQGKSKGGDQINTEAVSMIKHFLNVFKSKPATSDLFESFTVLYRSDEGSEELFNLLNGKKEVVVECDPNEPSDRKWYELIKTHLDSFVNNLQ